MSFYFGTRRYFYHTLTYNVKNAITKFKNAHHTVPSLYPPFFKQISNRTFVECAMQPNNPQENPKNRISVLSDMVQSAVKSCIANVFFY